jgi:hypothetical protein
MNGMHMCLLCFIGFGIKVKSIGSLDQLGHFSPSSLCICEHIAALLIENSRDTISLEVSSTTQKRRTKKQAALQTTRLKQRTREGCNTSLRG